MDRDFEMEYKDEQIKELRDIIAGTIKESGFYEYSMNGKYKWNINYSSILTRLIQEAGRWCEHFASDLFILWKSIDKQLENREIEDGRVVFAFRDSGVDGNSWYENHKTNPHYYRAVWFLDIETNEDKIKMTLHK